MFHSLETEEAPPRDLLNLQHNTQQMWDEIIHGIVKWGQRYLLSIGVQVTQKNTVLMC